MALWLPATEARQGEWICSVSLLAQYFCEPLYAFAHGKTSSGKRLQRATYDDLRRQFGLPSQMACNVPRQVGSTCQALWTKARKNAEARRLGYTKWRGVRLDQATHYVSPTLTYNLGRDHSPQGRKGG